MATANLMWIGNTDQLNLNPNTNIPQGQANVIKGWTAEGKDEIKAVEVEGNDYNSGSRFHTSYQGEEAGWGLGGWSPARPPSEMDYDSPEDGAVSGLHITTFVQARYKITVHDEDGNASERVETGVLIQMSNGDLFMRPALDTVDDWDGIDTISKIEIVSVQPWGNNMYPATIGFNVGIFETEVVCFVRGTLIECGDGPRAVESLKIGDLVRTADNGLKPLRWIASQKLSAELTTDPRLRPIRIRAGALGEGVPSSDLMVSPQHRILVRSKIADRLFGALEVLVAAKQLLALDGVEIADEVEGVEYFHFAFDQHEIVIANGTETESLYPGPEALKSIKESAREELFAIFPDLREQREMPISARQLTPGRAARNLAARHAKHARPLIDNISA